MKKYICLLVCLLLCATLCLASCDKGNGEKVGRPSGGNGSSVPTMGNADGDDDEDEKKYEKTVALTLDDGPHNVRTKAIVDELDKYGFNATFFVVGNRVDGTDYNGSSALKYAYEHGNEIGIHGYTHSVYYDSCSDSVYKAELSDTEKAIKAVIPKYSVKLMRPVGGKITDKRVKSCKYSVIMWSVDSEDWKYQYSTSGTDEANEKRDTIVENVMSQVSDGDIILMHDIYQSTYDAVVIILEQLNEQGYGVVTVSELLGKGMSSGKKYSRVTSTPEETCLNRAKILLCCTNLKEKSDTLC